MKRLASLVALALLVPLSASAAEQSGKKPANKTEKPAAAAPAQKHAKGLAKKNDKIEIIGGASVDGALDLEKIKFLALLPSMDQLRGKIIGILQAPGAQLARLANAYATKDQNAA